MGEMWGGDCCGWEWSSCAHEFVLGLHAYMYVDSMATDHEENPIRGGVTCASVAARADGDGLPSFSSPPRFVLPCTIL